MPQNIWLKRINRIVNKQTILLQLGQKVEMLSGNYLAETAKVGLSAALLGQKLDLVMRQGGEKIHLYGRVGAWPLKKAIQEAQIFPGSVIEFKY